MKILLISYGDMDYDGRLRSLYNVFSEMGTVCSFTRGKKAPNKDSRVYNKSYRKFIVESIIFSKSIDGIDWLVLDNRKATIPGLVLKKMIHPSLVIQDCRELYLINEVKHFSGKVGCIFEKTMAQKADIVICANKERAKIMKKEYSLSKVPLVYENLRKLEYGVQKEIDAAKKRIDGYIHEEEFRIISSSGCSIKRTNDILVNNLGKIDKPCRLFLVGDSTVDDKERINTIISDNGLTNVEIMGRLNQTELKYLISQCHIGIVNYGQYDTNNKLCASGKLYEFLYEGIPVVTTTNPPLKRIVDKYKIGAADDEYYNGINSVIKSYSMYLENVRVYTENHSIYDNDKKLISDIEQYKNLMGN